MSIVSIRSLESKVLPAIIGICVMQILPYFVFVHPYIQLLVSGSSSVFVGCVRSLRQKKTESMTSKDAYMFPVIGSGVLFGLYILIKYVSKEYVNILLGLYFFIIGIFVVHATVHPYLQPLLPKKFSTHKPYHILFQIPFIGENGKVDLKVTQADFVSASIGAIIGFFYLRTKNWVLNNLFGVMFTIQGIENISIGSIKIGVVLLCGLFIYDIFWVFGTDVMVTVAKGFEAPIKLVFPKTMIVSGEETKFSMLGLGDLVIPGIYVAMLLRYDNIKLKGKAQYFIYCFSGYVVGLLSTVGVMHVFQAAQPALLYLVPACLLTSLVPAYFANDIQNLFAYTEEEEEKKKVVEKKK